MATFRGLDGTFTFSESAKTITASSQADPTQITATAHGLVSGQGITITGESTATPALNGDHIVTLVDVNNFTIPVDVSSAGTDGAFQAPLVMANMVSWSVNTQLDILEASAMGAAWKSNKGGMGQWTGQAVARVDLANAAMLDAVNDLLIGTPLGLSRPMRFNVSGLKYYFGNGVVTQVGVAAAVGNIVELSLTFLGDGALALKWV